MKIDPIKILLDENFIPDKKFYFISGNEITLMEKITALIIKKYKKNEKVSVKEINSVNNFVNEEGLFENKRIFFGKNCKGLDENNISNIEGVDGIFIFIQENSQKLKKIKNFFIKNMNSYVFDCYELDRGSKIKILNQFLNINKIKIDEDVYWLLVDKLDPKYIFLENTLNKILEIDSNEINVNNINKILAINDSGKEKLFFSLLNKNRDIVSAYKEKILSASDVNELYYFSKFFCQLIIDCNTVDDYNKKIPLYLFKEKNTLIEIYKNYNSKKKKLLLNLLSNTEKVLRKHSGLSMAYGLRFLLSIKKITIS